MKIVSPLRVGSVVLIRTVTNYYTGEIALLSPSEIVLKSAAWIASTGRYAAALEKGTLDEVEPYPGTGVVSVSRQAIVDVAPWSHPLPREVK